MLETVYSEAWKLGFKVSLAVVPYVKATQQRLIPPRLRNANKYFSIKENEELVAYLLKKMEKGQVDIIQHGYSHERMKGKPEFASSNFALINEKLREGNEILRRTFGRDVSVFAAPHERISKATMKSLIQNKISLCRKYTTGRFLLHAPLSNSNLRTLTQTFLRNPNPFGTIHENVFAFEGISIIQWAVFLLGKDIKAQIEEAKYVFLKQLAIKDAFIIAHHYWEYFDKWKLKAIRNERIRYFNEFLRFVGSKSNVWKTTLSEIDLLTRGNTGKLQSK